MEKLTEEKLNELIKDFEDMENLGACGWEDFISCLLELKQLRAEKRNGQKDDRV